MITIRGANPLLGAVGLIAASLWPSPAPAQSASESRPTLVIPRVEQAPALEDFLEMRPSSAWEGRLAKVTDFIQSHPTDGAPATENTDVYVGYNDENLFVIFVAFDSRPENVRARMARRENIDNADDWVEVALDTFNDQRRGYLFDSNALGVQWDALWTEGQGEDSTFDTVYHTAGRRTDQGYVLWMAIPFKSLRFPASAKQRWGIYFRRFMPRVPEYATWPHLSSRIQGLLNQAATLEGLENISPTRNFQMIPYGTFRSFRALDYRQPSGPQFVDDGFDPDGGVDAKLVFKDSLVVDVTGNPDFSQVESDSPQVTVNQRFEVFFPEKRPFFLENANFFRTPYNLVFTRRIADPQLGARLTGKMGPYALGALFSDDQAPGKRALPGEPEFEKRARIGVVRLSRDILRQSSIGLIATDRELEGTYNRVGGVDGLFKVGRNWTSTFQAVTSATHYRDGTRAAGPAYLADVTRNGRQLNFSAAYRDIGEDFATDLGFVNRTGFRRIGEDFSFRFRPEGDVVIAWGPDLAAHKLWARDGTRLDWSINPQFTLELVGQTRISAFYDRVRERVRPRDYPVLEEELDFPQETWGFRASSNYFAKASLFGILLWGRAVNFVPPKGKEPFPADRIQSNLRVTLQPVTPLRIQNDYILSRLEDTADGGRVFDNHIVRSTWNWQFTKELSIRFIAQYDAVLTEPERTRLSTTKNINIDFLLTYRVNPWTALFTGFNTNSQNIFLCESPNPGRPGCEGLSPGRTAISRTDGGFLNDGRQFFVKLSYLLRF